MVYLFLFSKFNVYCVHYVFHNNKKKKVGNKHGNRVFLVLIVFLNKKKRFSKTIIKQALGF